MNDGKEGASGVDGPRVSECILFVTEELAVNQCFYHLSVDRVGEGQRGRVELLDPLADRDLLEGVAPLGYWEKGGPRYVESRLLILKWKLNCLLQTCSGSNRS